MKLPLLARVLLIILVIHSVVPATISLSVASTAVSRAMQERHSDAAVLARHADAAVQTGHADTAVQAGLAVAIVKAGHADAAAVQASAAPDSNALGGHADATVKAGHADAAAVQASAAPDSNALGGHADADAQAAAAPKRAASISWVTLEKHYPGVFVTHGPRGRRRAALTFDDVPDPRYTGKVLDVLARYHVQATFFVLGSLAARHPALVKRMQREGHAVGNHSYSHALFSQLTQQQFNRQIARTDAVLTPLVGYSPRFIRPPYGEVRPKQLQWAKRNGYVVVNWDVDSVDWRSLRSRSVILNIRRTIQPGSIILQHAGGGPTQDLSGTVEALPRIIRLLQSKGYELVTIPELLGGPPGRRGGTQ